MKWFFLLPFVPIICSMPIFYATDLLTKATEIPGKFKKITGHAFQWWSTLHQWVIPDCILKYNMGHPFRLGIIAPKDTCSNNFFQDLHFLDIYNSHLKYEKKNITYTFYSLYWKSIIDFHLFSISLDLWLAEDGENRSWIWIVIWRNKCASAAHRHIRFWIH